MALDSNGKIIEETTSGNRPYLFGEKNINAQRSVLVDPDGNNVGSVANPVKIAPAGASALTANVLNVTTAGTRVQLPSILCREVLIIAKKGNLGTIFVGGSTVSPTVYGAALDAEGSISLNVQNANMIYIDATVNGEGVSYFAI